MHYYFSAVTLQPTQSAGTPAANPIPLPIAETELAGEATAERWAEVKGRWFDIKTKHTICEHKKRKTLCKVCGGGSLCPHKKQKQTCRECGGSSLCDHSKQKSKCKQCKLN
jgi:hypothetical protein